MIKYTIEQINPIDKLIVIPGPENYFKQVVETPDKDKNKHKGKEDVKVLKKVTEKIKTDYVVGKVVSLGTTDPNSPWKDVYKLGDWVMFHRRLAVPLDILGNKLADPKCPLMLKYYDVVGIVNNDELNEI
jgi:hypothetical protein